MRFQYETATVFPKSAINGLTKQLNSLRFNRPAPHARDIYDGMQMEQVGSIGADRGQWTLYSHILHFAKPRRIERVQTAFGKAWLKQWFYKLDGTPRSGKRTEEVSQRVLMLANRVSRFEFIGVLQHCNAMGEALVYTPIYRAFTSDGEYFDYSPIHMGFPIIMEGY